MVEFLTTRKLAEALGVSESSVKRWIDDGRIAAARTPGGHRRIAFSDALKFMREKRLVTDDAWVAQGAPGDSQNGTGDWEDLREALIEADLRKVQQILIGSWLADRPIASIWDELVCPAMEGIGRMWKAGSHGIAIEHRATDLVMQVVGQLRSMIEGGVDRPRLAVGCGPEMDPYQLPSMAVSSVLVEAGWRAWNLGPLTPLAALLELVKSRSPELVWVCVSREFRPDEMDHLIEQIQKTRDCLLVVGGRGIPSDWTGAEGRFFQGRNMTELAGFLHELEPAVNSMNPNARSSRNREPGVSTKGRQE